MLWPRHRFARSNACPEARYRTVSCQHEMIAVVDRKAELRIVIGAAPPARLRGRIGNLHLEARLNRSHRGRKPGKAGPDNRRSSEAQPVTSSRATVKRSAGLLTRTRWRGGTHPVLSI